MLRNRASAADRLEFCHEAEMMLQLDSNYLVRLVGVCIQQAPWLMVLEFLKYGDLRNSLKAAAGKGLKFELSEQIRILVQIAKGMEFMEKNDMVHMDLAARNCLLGSKNACKVGVLVSQVVCVRIPLFGWVGNVSSLISMSHWSTRVCAVVFRFLQKFCYSSESMFTVLYCTLSLANLQVADFGLTVKLEGGKEFHVADIHQKLPIKWCAIESLENRRFSAASDVWAFGIVAWEVFEYGLMPCESSRPQSTSRLSL